MTRVTLARVIEVTEKPRLRSEHTTIVPRLGPAEFRECKSLVGQDVLPADYEGWCDMVAEMETRAKAESRVVIPAPVKPDDIRASLARRKIKPIRTFDDLMKYAKWRLRITSRGQNRRRRFSLISLD